MSLLSIMKCFFLPEFPYVGLAASYVVFCQMMTVDCGTSGCAGSFLYLRDIRVVHPHQEYRATVRDNGTSAKCFFPAAAVVYMGSFILIESIDTSCGSTAVTLSTKSRLICLASQILRARMLFVMNISTTATGWWPISNLPPVML